mgnify:CR=1 FL=1
MPAYIETFAWAIPELKKPWHGLGNGLEDYMTSSEAITAAGLDWTVKQQPLFFDKNTVHSDLELELPPDLSKISTHKALVRDSDNRVLSVMGHKYNVLQNVEAFDFTDNLVAGGEMEYVTAGSVKGGQVVFMVGRIKSDPLEIVPGDVAEKYVLFVNSHDGSFSVTVKFVATLVVCMNTLVAALAEKRRAMKIKHTRNMKARMEEGKKILGLADAKYARMKALAQQMARISMPKSEFNKFALQLVAPGKNQEDLTNAQERAVDNLNYLYVAGPGQEIEGRAGTVWGAHNAVTAWTSHVRTTRHERIRYTLMGQGDAINAKAEDMLVKQYQLAA